MRRGPRDASSVSRFLEALRLGQVDVVRRMIYRDPSLANARSSLSPHATSLMISATSNQSLKNTLTLVKLLLAKGASLRTKDDHRCNVLMSVCASGAHPSVVKCLLDWHKTNSSCRVLLWSDKDDKGRTALGLACLHGHGRLASFLLDLLEEEEPGISLYALNMALKSEDERCVMELLRNHKLQWLVAQDRREAKLMVHGEWNQTQRTESGEEELTVASCVAKAVELEMVRVVSELHRLNRRCVGHATWFALCGRREVCRRAKTSIERRSSTVRPEFEEIAALYRQDCVWERIKFVFLIRYHSERSLETMERNIVADLPDAVFRIVADFLKPKFDDAEEAQKERFKAVLDLSSW
ncbi:hypothetical protein JG687_00013636 [Phytophthora cactorum]|uniref:Uncharacterized protein n=1 Tax=Phytophthora cactorum TaxID=29920 RepID=A0A329S5K8_9STRA|nr:Ankyrin repeat-containing domain [Phytophthora cactorum]KAG2782867.1 hypothetical protein Pcac1_g7387 [Phytophthora cactorum]KAG2906808.1 hypothetical protein PC114_g11030 [Phytophthora cactorum]KAG3168582.1 hypothetical protein C6341_g11289 [Phytophthora cactorum]KAG3211529.1 hypothetical protein PC129_g17498 [Phytophthora cactorum]